MTAIKTQTSNREIDTICIYDGYIGCPNCHCENCGVFHKEKLQTPVENYYKFWFAYLQVNDEIPESLSKRRLYGGGGKMPRSITHGRRPRAMSQLRYDQEINAQRYRIRPTLAEAAKLRPRHKGKFVPKGDKNGR